MGYWGEEDGKQIRKEGKMFLIVTVINCFFHYVFDSCFKLSLFSEHLQRVLDIS